MSAVDTTAKIFIELSAHGALKGGLSASKKRDTTKVVEQIVREGLDDFYDMVMTGKRIVGQRGLAEDET
tara:strand:+ start:90 stop:296 length:207 start_codon:yes stop_codon:yes gene_type:complete